jgi:hypothetical protein
VINSVNLVVHLVTVPLETRLIIAVFLLRVIKYTFGFRQFNIWGIARIDRFYRCPFLLIFCSAVKYK